jgi:hypothetical protein
MTLSCRTLATKTDQPGALSNNQASITFIKVGRPESENPLNPVFRDFLHLAKPADAYDL